MQTTQVKQPKLFRATTTVLGMQNVFVDWCQSDTLESAQAQHDAELLIFGVPTKQATVEYVECNPTTLKPINS